MKKILLLLTTFSLLLLVACGGKTDDTSSNSGTGETDNQEDTVKTEEPAPTTLIQFEPLADNEREVEMETTMGNIKIKLFPEQAPKAVENFITHAENGYYNDLLFHRVINDFMIQGGDPTGTGMGGESIWGTPFEDEFTNKLYNFRGSLSMANSGADTNGSQFFINQAGPDTFVANGGSEEGLISEGYAEIAAKKYVEVGGNQFLDNRHTVFGQVTEGMDVVDAIAAVESSEDRPVEDVKIVKINILK